MIKLIPLNKRNISLSVIGLCLFSFMLYSQTLFFEFIWDDLAVISFNKNIRSTEIALKTFYQKSKQPYNVGEFKSITELTSKNWRPLRTVVHALVYKVFKLNPLGYHLMNVIFHALVVVLLFFLLLQLVDDLFAALVGALLFAVHPVNSEVVCWSKSLEDLLATFFLLITFNLILQLKNSYGQNLLCQNNEYSTSNAQCRSNEECNVRLDCNKRNVIFVLLAIFTYALALMAKLSVIFFPVFLLLFLIYRNLGEFRQFKLLVKRNLWFLVVLVFFIGETVCAVIARSLILGHTAQGTYITGSCWTTWLSMPRIFLRYLHLELFSYPLYADYMNFPRANSVTDPIAWGYTIVFLSLFVYISWLLYKKEWLAPWLLFWCALLPFTNIIAMNQLGAERFLYIPTIAAVWLTAEIFKRYSMQATSAYINNNKIKLLIAIYALFFLLFLGLTVNRSQVWNNRFIFWSTATEQFPHSQRARRNLILAYIHIKQPEKALPYAQGLIQDYPQEKNITLYAHVLYLSGNPRQVINGLYRHKKIASLNYIAIIAAKRHDFSNAESAATLGYKLQPDKASYDTLNRVALYAAKAGAFTIAERCLFLASGIGKNDNTVNRVAIHAAQQGKLDVAERCFIFAAKINPTNKNYARNIKLLQRQRQQTGQ
jgi:tetratricopeptide (TPR) repeat protein